MRDTSQLDQLRATYRSLWDAHQIIADQNVRQAHAGKLLTVAQLKNEQQAAEAVLRARDEVLAAMRAASELSSPQNETAYSSEIIDVATR